MVISVLERRQEIGLRRALGATRGQIRIQFLSEAILLALTGGAAGVILGAVSTAVYAHIKGWAIVIPPEAWGGGLAAAIAIGAVAGLLPAIRASACHRRKPSGPCDADPMGADLRGRELRKPGYTPAPAGTRQAGRAAKRSSPSRQCTWLLLPRSDEAALASNAISGLVFPAP